MDTNQNLSNPNLQTYQCTVHINHGYNVIVSRCMPKEKSVQENTKRHQKQNGKDQTGRRNHHNQHL